ncbi:hypothetical protein GQ457_17G024380 [Hibiscus cannabinus]
MFSSDFTPLVSSPKLPSNSNTISILPYASSSSPNKNPSATEISHSIPPQFTSLVTLYSKSMSSNSSASRFKPTHLKLFESLCGFVPFVFDLLVKSCLQMKRLDVSIEIVRILMSRGIRPQVTTCNALISEFLKCHGINEGYEVYKEVFALGNVENECNKKKGFKSSTKCLYL